MQRHWSRSLSLPSTNKYQRVTRRTKEFAASWRSASALVYSTTSSPSDARLCRSSLNHRSPPLPFLFSHSQCVCPTYSSQGKPLGTRALALAKQKIIRAKRKLLVSRAHRLDDAAKESESLCARGCATLRSVRRTNCMLSVRMRELRGAHCCQVDNWINKQAGKKEKGRLDGDGDQVVQFSLSLLQKLQHGGSVSLAARQGLRRRCST